ncbi:hypothetical protein EVAR_31512_1 [Eumeta japonica]|uniref:Uncharacterized protein n=1 Tax=Eumeta variegata TaxID=151549 RepID=A0A4C1Z0W9_EUMVA|nr:hypothetical protein EVAR_31512_1 [Eumeta japonica]
MCSPPVRHFKSPNVTQPHERGQRRRRDTSAIKQIPQISRLVREARLRQPLISAFVIRHADPHRRARRPTDRQLRLGFHNTCCLFDYKKGYETIFPLDIPILSRIYST